MLSPIEKLALSIKRLQDTHQRLLDAHLDPHGVTLVQWHALREIDRHPGSSQTHLSHLTFNSPQALGTLMSRMESAGLIRRESSPGRAFAVHLTPRGRNILKEGRRSVLAGLAQSFVDLSDDDLVTLQKILDKALGDTPGIE